MPTDTLWIRYFATTKSFCLATSLRRNGCQSSALLPILMASQIGGCQTIKMFVKRKAPDSGQGSIITTKLVRHFYLRLVLFILIESFFMSSLHFNDKTFSSLADSPTSQFIIAPHSTFFTHISPKYKISHPPQPVLSFFVGD